MIERESIVVAGRGIPVPLERIAANLADALRVTQSGGQGSAIDDGLLARVLLEQMAAAGAFTGELDSRDLPPELRRWLAESTRLLVERGHLHGDPVRPRQSGSGDALAEWAVRFEVWSTDQDLWAQVQLLDATLRALPRILAGGVRATDVMFPNSSMRLVEGIYRGNTVTDMFNGVMADAVVEVLGEVVRRDPAARLRLLEVGAGTGGGTVGVLRALEPFEANVETYCYTDVSRSFLMHAEKEYGPRYPYLDYRLLDTERPLAGQGFELGGYDIVLATNVLHATADIRRTLRNAKAALKTDAVLLVNEMAAHSLFAHLTFGLLEGWWRYEDAELRIEGCPALSADSWQDLLEEEGFDAVSFPAREHHRLGYQIIAAASDGLIRQELAEEPTAPRPARAPREQAPRAIAPRVEERSAEVADDLLAHHAEDVVFEQLKVSLKVDRSHIAVDDAFMDHGIDSILGVQLVQEINRGLGIDLATTDLFDHGSVEQLARHIVETYRPQVIASRPGRLPAAPPPVSAQAPLPMPVAEPRTRETISAGGLVKEPIAIIGMSGRYGGADNVSALWEHLVNGHDLVDEVSRWDLADYHPAGAEYCRHGSFIDDVDRFDPVFFNISGVEATYMDPQQRVFLEESWKALEDAGYAGAGAQGARCGVYVGCQESGYAALQGADAPAQAMWGASLSAMPARISYFLDLRGPAIAVDTACSSSLVAMHLACQGLWGRETDLALAGGVSIQCTPKFYLVADQAGMLSPTGRCHTFDDRADGFVPGEGVGVVVLKRLSDALADGDHIHGVIRGSGVNQDGTSNGITAPSAKSQERLETAVYQEFGVNPEHLQLVEAHGTGTKLGDPIEYHALKRAFRKHTDRTDYCALGSIKSNLGHTTTAAGVAGVIKVLLSLRHKTIPPSLHFERGNSHIDFADTPFYINTTAQPWAEGGDGTRRAAVSSFGVSGTNAHLVIEQAPAVRPAAPARSSHLVTLSAVTEAQLREQVERLVAHCGQEPGVDLGDVAFTLFTGRKPLRHRLAVVAHDLAGLVAELQRVLSGIPGPRVYQGAVPEQGHREQQALRGFGVDCVSRAAGTDDPAALVELLGTVADLYVRGYRLPYDGLFAPGAHRRVPLPTYPFARERYWVSEAAIHATTPASAALVHPLLHTNTSTFDTHRHRSVFTGAEFFLSDHRVHGSRVLPGVACLEMARAAAVAAFGGTNDGSVVLNNVVWARPVVVDGAPVTLTTSLVREADGAAAYEITSADDGTVHSQGRVTVDRRAAGVLDVPTILATCDKAAIAGEQLYPAYERIGFAYGPAHQGIQRLHIGHDEVLARLDLPASARAALDDFVLHPGLLDATLQASLGMAMAAPGVEGLDVSGMKPALPFALDELEVHGPCAPAMWAWIRHTPGSTRDGAVLKLDVDLCDDSGNIRVRLRRMSYRILDGAVSGLSQSAPLVSRVDFLPRWEPDTTVAEHARAEHVVLVPDLPDLVDELAARVSGARVLPLTSAAHGAAERFTEHTEQVLAHVQRVIAETSGDVLVQLVVPEDPEGRLVMGTLGLLKSTHAEQPRLRAQAVLLDPADTAAAQADRLAEARRYPAACVRFRGGAVESQTWAEASVEDEPLVPWKAGGVYLVTGGLGGVGALVAEDIVMRAFGATVVLVGRSPLRPEHERLLRDWRDRGGTVEYRQADVSLPEQTRGLIDGLLRDHGALHGVLHAAGVLRDGLVTGKTAKGCREVLAPKVSGVVNLDEATADVELDFFATFAGGAGVFGNVGQADYAAANAFLDAYSHLRHDLVGRGARHGASVAIDWPLWADGGMRVDAGTEAVMRTRLGMVQMPTVVGIAALHSALGSARTQVLVLAGDADRIRDAVLGRVDDTKQATDERAPAVSSGTDVTAALTAYLRNALAEAIHLPAHRIEAGVTFDRYGIDSVLALAVTNRLEADFGSLSKTLLFEHHTVAELARHFESAHAAALGSVLGLPNTPLGPVALAALPPVSPVRTAPDRSSEMHVRGPVEEDIAVIGMSGRYPGARDLDELWDNLLAGRDSVTEVPPDRWDHDRHYDPNGDRLDRTANKWGGFLDGVDEFDSLLFAVSPREAAIMDPQTRLFLECAWQLLEGACHTREVIAGRHGGKVGVYVGTMYQHYQLLAADPVHESITSVLSSASIANRVSHFFDLTGPSLTLDTTCSSSLVAIHLACEELRRGGCELMIAGGVNLSLHPKKYLGLGLTGLTGSGPDSRAFLDGDGFIPAEGVGAVLLKPLSRALADGDEVLAVIKSSAVNHKGRTSGPMVPSVEQQARLIEDNLAKAGVHPRTVSYVEASANGSQIGDALEFAALERVFSRHTPDRGFCAVGSVKSGIGNAEAASGVVQLSKVALQLRHGTLVPLAKAGALNPGVDFDNSAFYLPDALTEWRRPVLDIDGTEHEYPRRATISAFGAGGTNAHLVVEEYRTVDKGDTTGVGDAGRQIVVLSARTEDRLRAYALRLLDFVRADCTLSVVDLAHTFQCGREAMDHRLALVVRDPADLIAGLNHYLDGNAATSPVATFMGSARPDRSDLGALLSGGVGDAVLATVLADDDREKLALFWAQGGAVPWSRLPSRGRAPRLLHSAPTYPFERVRHWLPATDAPTAWSTSAAVTPAAQTAPAERDGLAERVTAIVADLLRAPDLAADTVLADYGFDSMLAVQLIKRIQIEIDPDAGPELLADCVTARDIVLRLVRGQVAPRAAASRFPEAVRLNSVTTGEPVFWFHGGLGGVEVYASIAAVAKRPFYGIQARGWMTDAEPLVGITAMAAHYADIVQSVRPNGPYDLGGYSLGGLLAYEVARQLQERGAEVADIVMLDAMYGDDVKAMTMSRTDMLLQQVNALLAARTRPPAEPAFVTASEVEWTGTDDAVLDQLIGLAAERGLTMPADALRTLVVRNIRVHESYEVLDYEVRPLPRPNEVTCFYFRNRGGLFFGDLEPVFSTRTGGKSLDHADYWSEWRRQLPDFHMLDVDSANHFVMLGDEVSATIIGEFCGDLYTAGPVDLTGAKRWLTERGARSGADS